MKEKKTTVKLPNLVYYNEDDDNWEKYSDYDSNEDSPNKDDKLNSLEQKPTLKQRYTSDAYKKDYQNKRYISLILV
jgi:hypothetical protein